MTSSTPPVVAPANSSVIDKLRASGMTDDQIINAIMGFGAQQAPAPVPTASGNDVVGQMRQQGYSDEQITATVVAAAASANIAGSGDPTAAGGVAPSLDVLQAQLDEHAGNVSNVAAANDALTRRTAANEDDINDHSGRLARLEAWLDEHGAALRELVSDVQPKTDGDASTDADADADAEGDTEGGNA